MTNKPQLEAGRYHIARQDGQNDEGYVYRVKEQLQLAIFHGWVPRNVRKVGNIVECDLTIPDRQTTPNHIPPYFQPGPCPSATERSNLDD